MPEIFLFLQKWVNLEGKTQHAVITHDNISTDIKIPTFFGKSWGMMLHLSSASLKAKVNPVSHVSCSTEIHV